MHPLLEQINQDITRSKSKDKHSTVNKTILKSGLVPLALNFNKQYKLTADSSDIDAGSVLLQEVDNGVNHPVCYFSKK